MNDATKVHLTQEGYDELKAEIEELRLKEPAAVERVERARNFGDLSENSEYHTAREDLAMIQGRIEELEDILARSAIVNGNSNKNGQIDLGCTVTIETDGKEITYTIVGEYEADPLKKKISHDSPLGRALIGKKANEVVEYEAPVGKIMYTIKKVH